MISQMGINKSGIIFLFLYKDKHQPCRPILVQQGSIPGPLIAKKSINLSQGRHQTTKRDKTPQKKKLQTRLQPVERKEMKD